MKILPMNFYTYPEIASLVLRTKEYQELILENQSGVIFANGSVWSIIGKKCGPGLYKVSLERKK
jgi:hypothetical protein